AGSRNAKTGRTPAFRAGRIDRGGETCGLRQRARHPGKNAAIRSRSPGALFSVRRWARRRARFHREAATAIYGKIALECAGRAKRRRRFMYDKLQFVVDLRHRLDLE